MPKGYRTINLNDKLYEKLQLLANRESDLSKVSMAQMIERMIKVYEDNVKA